MEKVTRRTMKRWSGLSLSIFAFFSFPIRNVSDTFLLDYAQDHMDLGAAWNGFSLNEQGELSGAIEKTGQAIDATYMSTTRLVSLSSSKLTHVRPTPSYVPRKCSCKT